MKGTFLFLGTSASAGVPMIGCKCAVCQSSSPLDKRLRPSGLIQIDGKSLLIDAGPDLRQQALKFGIDHLDGLLLTHTHYDHIAGIDELRLFYFRQKKPFPCLLSQESLVDLKKRYFYLFLPPGEGGPTVSAQLDCHLLEGDTGKTEFLGIPIRYCSYKQGNMKVNGYRIGDFAYISDIRDYDDSIFHELKGVRTLVLSALKTDPSPLHLTLSEAVAFAARVGAEKTWLTHFGHFLDHNTANSRLPPSVRMGYDGLKLDFTCTK